MNKISVIMPIFNMEKFLRRSVKSIQDQTLKNIEIILVNDGSTDGSLKICKELQRNDKRIKLVNKENGGVSSARNAGLEIAKGEYIGFVDADDWIEKNMYESMLISMNDNKADVCMCNYVVENDNTSKIIDFPFKNSVLTRTETIDLIVSNMISPSDLDSGATTIMGSVCRLLIKKDIISFNNLRFPIDINMREDLIFSIKLLVKANTTTIEESAFYHYFTNLKSASKDYQLNANNTVNEVYSLIKDIIYEENLYERLKTRLDLAYAYTAIDLIANIMHPNNPSSMKKKIKEIDFICSDEKLKKIITSIDSSNYSLRKKLTLGSIEKNRVYFLYIYYKLFNIIWYR